MRVLGIDVSSSAIGYCVLEIDELNNIHFVSMSFLKPLKKGSIIERIVDTRNKINHLLEEIKPDVIGIENIIQFMKGKSTAKTIIMLTTFNRMVCLAAYDYLQKAPELFNVMSIRHGLKLSKELPKKEEMPEIISQHLKIAFPYIYNKKKKHKIENYDMADGAAVALYYSFILTKRIIKKDRKTKKNAKK